MSGRPKIAFLFRYGAGEHTELFHALPEVLRRLGEAGVEVHYVGMRSGKADPAGTGARFHALPWKVDRTRGRDKWAKTLLWLAALPWIGLWCRVKGMDGVYMDETLPLSLWLLGWFWRGKTAVTVADMFTDIYLRGKWAWLGRRIKAADERRWRRADLIFTRAKATVRWLEERVGVEKGRAQAVYDPCDTATYRPATEAERAEARRALGYGEGDVVLVHHGILHPNKGNDRILRALAEVRKRRPEVKYLLVGDGPEGGRLRALAAELGLGEAECRFTGWLETLAEVNRTLGAGDIGLVMRTGEESDDFHMTGALVHSMACGLPVLAARLGGVSEVVEEGRNGRLFGANDMGEFARQLEAMAGDAEGRRRMGAAAHSDALRLFDMAKVAGVTAAELAEMVGADGDGGAKDAEDARHDA